jgi:lysophospholipase L1-like esterase
MRFLPLLMLLAATIAASFTPSRIKKIVFFGDSITEAAVQPGGYISQIQAILQVRGTSSQFALHGAGISGNKVYDLYLRLENDVINKKPHLVFVYVGVNDVWHKQSFGTGTDADKFVRFYQAIIDKIQSSGAQVVLCTPACIGEKTDFTNTQDGELNRFAQLIRDLARENNLALVDLRKSFLDYNLKHNPDNEESGILTTDGVHLNEKGNKLVAESMLSHF